MTQKIYLDTNLLLDMFVAQGRALRESREPVPTKKFAFLIEHRRTFHYVTSVLTKAEIMRELVSARHHTPPEVERVWEDGLHSLECSYVPQFSVSDRLVTIASVPLKIRTMLNFLHAVVAEKEGAHFVSGDKDIVQKLKSAGAAALTYPELRQLATGAAEDQPSSQGPPGSA